MGGDFNNIIDLKSNLIKLCRDDTLQLVDVLKSN